MKRHLSRPKHLALVALTGLATLATVAIPQFGCDDSRPGPFKADGSAIDIVGNDDADATPADGLTEIADDTLADSDLPPSHAWQDDLAFLREEEKLARDVYIVLFGQWNLNIFNNISKSEQTHTDQVKAMLATKGLADPVVDDTVGVFEDSILAGLYTDLTTLGEASKVAALTVGATIEDLDIKDIAEMMTRTDDPAILSMYESLMCGSRNHLRSFFSQLENNGAGYQPQFISQTEFDAIVGDPKETCGG